MEPLSPPLLARTRRNDLTSWELAGQKGWAAPPEYSEEESVDLSPFYNIFASTNFIVENSFRVAPESEPEEWDRDTKFLSVSDQILYLDNRNLIVLDYKPTYENNKP